MEKFANSLRRIGNEASVIGVLNVIHWKIELAIEYEFEVVLMYPM